MEKFGPARLASLIALAGTTLVAAAACSSTFLWGNREALAIYFLLIALAGVVVQWRSLPGEEESAPRYWIVPMLLLALIAAYLRMKDIGTALVWSDEDNQNGLILLRPDTVNVAAWSQQPPIFYYLSLLGRKLLGNSPFGLRFFSALLGSAAVPAFYLFLLRLSRHALLAFAGAFALALNPWAVSYSIEAKPYACGMFFAVVFLHCSREFYLGQGPRRAAIWMLSALLLLLSIGFQSMILVAAVGGGILLFPPERSLRQAAACAAILAAAALLFLPFLLNTIANENGFLRPRSGLQFALGIDENFFPLLGGIASLLWAAALPPMLREKSKAGRFLLALLVALVVFPLLFTSIYHALVDYLLRPRHMLLFLPLALAAITGGLGVLQGWMARRFEHGAVFLQGVIFALALIYGYFSIGVNERAVEYKWLAAYDYLRERGRPGDQAFYFTLNQFDQFSADGFLLTDYYYPPEIRAKVKLSSRWENMRRQGGVIEEILDSFGDASRPSRIFLFYQNSESQVKMGELRYSRTPVEVQAMPKSGGEVWPFAGTMLTLDARAGKLEAWKGFLEDVDAQEPRAAVKSRLYELLAGIAIYQGKCARAAALLKQLRSTPVYEHVIPKNSVKLEQLMAAHCTAIPK